MMSSLDSKSQDLTLYIPWLAEGETFVFQLFVNCCDLKVTRVVSFELRKSRGESLTLAPPHKKIVW